MPLNDILTTYLVIPSCDRTYLIGKPKLYVGNYSQPYTLPPRYAGVKQPIALLRDECTPLFLLRRLGFRKWLSG